MVEYYSKELAQKVKRVLRESMLKGHILGANKLFGYTNVDKKYTIDPINAQIVLEIFHRYNGGETGPAICTELKKRGIKTVTGKDFIPNAIYV